MRINPKRIRAASKAGSTSDDLSDAEVAERFALQARGLTNNTQSGIDLKATMKAINDAIKNNVPTCSRQPS